MTDWDRVAKRRRAFAIVFHREGVSSDQDPVDVACRALQLGATGVASLVLEEFDESGIADRLTEPWRDYERNRLRHLLGILKRRPKKPPGPRLQTQP